MNEWSKFAYYVEREVLSTMSDFHLNLDLLCTFGMFYKSKKKFGPYYMIDIEYMPIIGKV